MPVKTLLLFAGLTAALVWPMTAPCQDAGAVPAVSATTLLNTVSEVTSCAFTIELPAAGKTVRGLGDFPGVDPAAGFTEAKLAGITDVRSAVRALESAFPDFIVGTSTDAQQQVRVLNLIHRDLIGTSPLDRELVERTYSGTLAGLGQWMSKEPAWSGFSVLSEPYSPGASIVLLNDIAPIAFTKYSGRVRGLLSAAVLQYDAKKMVLWKATVQGAGTSATVSVDFYPDGGGTRVGK
jgi:hypothetical protein